VVELSGGTPVDGDGAMWTLILVALIAFNLGFFFGATWRALFGR
jgi:hypothetical protein